MNVTLEDVKAALGITGHYQDAVIQPYFEEVADFLVKGGVPERLITTGLIARGVSDLWNYGSGEAKFSDYFIQRAAQLAVR